MTYELENFGSFFVGGRKVSLQELPQKTIYRGLDFPALPIDPNGNYFIEQAYVQFFIPKNCQGKNSIILVHGGGHTGAVWESTPDGRKGWLHYFLQAGYPVYVIDNVERGRAGWCSLPGIWPDEPEQRSYQQNWEAFRIGESAQYDSRTPYLGQRFPVLFFDNLVKYTVPRWHHNNEISTLAIVELVKKIGKSILITHSQSGPFGINVALQIPELIQAVVSLEPVALFIEPSKSILEPRFLFVYGDFLTPYWEKHRNRALNTAHLLQKADADVHWIDLPKLNIHGNSHQLMMDNNNFELAELVNQWLLNDKKYPFCVGSSG